MKYILNILLVFIVFQTQAQYKNLVIENDSLFEWSWVYNHDGTNLVSIGVDQDSNTVTNHFWSNVAFEIFDEDLNQIGYNTFTDSINYYWPSGNIVLVGDYYYSSTSKTDGGDTTKAVLFKFDTLGNVIWQKQYYPNYLKSIISNLSERNDTLFIAGSRCNDCLEPNSDIIGFLTAIDTTGNIIWERLFSGNLQTPRYVEITNDNGFIVSNKYWDYGYLKYYTKCYKLDSQGTTQWSKLYGAPTSDHFNVLTQMPNGNYLSLGISEDPLNESARSWMMFVNEYGGVIKDSVFDFSSGFDSFRYNDVIYKNDGFQVLGSTYDDEYSNTQKAFVARFDTSMNIKWFREFYPRVTDNWLVYQEELLDGFTLLAGIASNVPNQYTADDWFLIIDSLGCDIQDCSLSLDEPHLEKSKKLVKVVDIMGRETEVKSNTLLIYIYSDGTSKKIFRED